MMEILYRITRAGGAGLNSPHIGRQRLVTLASKKKPFEQMLSLSWSPDVPRSIGEDVFATSGPDKGWDELLPACN